MPEETQETPQLTAQDIEKLFNYLENMNHKLNNINSHLVFYTIVLILGIIVSILF